jgi:HAD superfamily hydrolase (TIGR01509 family)
MPIRAVAFDFDGLMFNTEDVYELSLVDFLGRRGIALTDAIRDGMIGRRPSDALRHLVDAAKLDEPLDLIQAELRRLFLELLDRHLRPMPSLFDLLDHLEARGIPKAVATSSDLRHLEPIFARYELRPRFQALLTAADVERGKPAPDIYLKAAAALGVSPSEMLVLEDSEAGTRAAAAAGALIVSVPSSHTARHDFSAARHVASSLGDPLIYRLLNA